MDPQNRDPVSLFPEHRIQVTDAVGMDRRFRCSHSLRRECPPRRLQSQERCPVPCHFNGGDARNEVRPPFVMQFDQLPVIARLEHALARV